MTELFDMKLRALRRDRAARIGPELFLHERAFADCLERITLMHGGFKRALLIGAPDCDWPERLRQIVGEVTVCDPGPLFATASGGKPLIEDAWPSPSAAYDLILAVGTLDTVNELPLALRLIAHALETSGLLIGALSGGETLPQLRSAMRAADAVGGVASPHIHPRVEAAALAPLLESAGFIRSVVDVDRVAVSYASFERLITDLRAMGATNILHQRPHYVSRIAREAAIRTFTEAGSGFPTVETFEILHFAAWTPSDG